MRIRLASLSISLWVRDLEFLRAVKKIANTTKHPLLYGLEKASIGRLNTLKEMVFVHRHHTFPSYRQTYLFMSAPFDMKYKMNIVFKD